MAEGGGGAPLSPQPGPGGALSALQSPPPPTPAPGAAAALPLRAAAGTAPPSPQPGPGGALAALQSPPLQAPAASAAAAASPLLPVPLRSAAADAAAEAAALAQDAAAEAAAAGGGGGGGGGEGEGEGLSWDRGDAPVLDEDEAAEEAAALQRARVEAEQSLQAAASAAADAAAAAAAAAQDEEEEAEEAEAAAAAAASAALRPSRPAGAPPFTAAEVRAAEKALEKLYRANAAEMRAAAKRAEAEERKRKQLEEAKRLEAERRAEAERLERKRQEDERERFILLARQGKMKARVLEPPPPPKNPPPWMPLNATTLLVPRGRLHIKINRVTGLGLFMGGTGARGDSASRTASGGGGGGLLGLLSGASTRTLSYDGAEHLQEGQKVRIGSVYVRFELHLGGGNVMAARSATYKNQVLGDFMPLGAEVEFRLSEGVVQAAVDEALPARTRTLLPPVLFYSAWQTDLPMGDRQLSDGQIPAGVLFQPLGELYADVTLPMAEKGGGEASPFFRYGDGTLRCWAACSYNFTPSVTGILAVSVHEGRDLAQTGVGKMDSYPSVSVGVGDNRALARLDGSVAGRARVAESVARGTVCKEGGDNPMFNHEELLLWVDHEHCSSGSRFVLTLHAEVLGGSVTIGAVSVPVRAWTLDGISHEEVLDIRAGGATSAVTGRAMLTRQFYPAGMLTVSVRRAHNLAQADLAGSDPYVKLALAGRMRSYAVRTAIQYKSGADPVWDETFVFDVVDHVEMRLSVWDFDRFTEDDLIGEVMVSLDDVYRLGVRDAFVAVKRANMFGTLEERGLVLVEVDFVGPAGLAYPMLQSARAAHTDAGRENRRLAGSQQAEREREERKGRALMSEEAKRLAQEAEEAAGEAEGGGGGGEGEAAARRIVVLEDDDIEDAFRALDFDKDLFLSRLELRHALTCMSEQITEMEVDEMVDMVDIDGDGQVAFYEFYQLCKARDLANPMWKPKAEAEYRKRDWFAEGGVRGLDGARATTATTGGGKELQALNAASVAKAAAANAARVEELRRRDAKRTACEGAVVEMGLRIGDLDAAFRRFKRHDSFRAGDRFEAGELSLGELAEVLLDARDPLSADAAVQICVRKLYEAFLGAEGRTELFDLLLGLAGFVGCTRPKRIKFCFDLFDRDGSKTLDASELMRVLKGSHLAGTTSYLRNKAVSIMKTVGCAADGAIDLEKFVVAANRFPSVFFPSFEARDANGELIKPEIKSKEKKALEKEKAEALARAQARESRPPGSSTLHVHVPGLDDEEEGAAEAAPAAAGGGGSRK